jgi:hypothetical protein
MPIKKMVSLFILPLGNPKRHRSYRSRPLYDQALCQIHVPFVSNSCQIHFKFISNTYIICVKFVSNSCQIMSNSCICVKFVSNSCQIHLKFVSNSCQIRVKFMSNSCQIHVCTVCPREIVPRGGPLFWLIE